MAYCSVSRAIVSYIAGRGAGVIGSGHRVRYSKAMAATTRPVSHRTPAAPLPDLPGAGQPEGRQHRHAEHQRLDQAGRGPPHLVERQRLISA